MNSVVLFVLSMSCLVQEIIALKHTRHVEPVDEPFSIETYYEGTEPSD